MAASYTAERKAAAAVGGAFSPASNCTTGSTLIMCVATSNVTAVSDSQGNTWHIDVTFTSGTSNIASICSAYQKVGLSTSDTITVTGSIASWDIWLEEFAGNYSAVDVTASAAGSASTTAPTGTTAATTAADEMAVCCVNSSNGITITKNASYTLFTTGQLNNSSRLTTGSAWYRILTATGTQTGSGTLSTMANSGGVIATYKQGVAPVATIPDVGMALTVT